MFCIRSLRQFKANIICLAVCVCVCVRYIVLPLSVGNLSLAPVSHKIALRHPLPRQSSCHILHSTLLRLSKMVTPRMGTCASRCGWGEDEGGSVRVGVQMGDG